MFDEKLASALNFTEEDLAANREGQMTIMQVARLQEHAKSETRWGLFGAVFIGALIASIGVADSLERGYTSFCSNCAFLVAVMAAIFVFSLTMSTRRAYIKELNNRQVKSVQGRAHCWRNRSDEAVLWIHIDDNRVPFSLRKDVSQEFVQDEYYRVYYIETGNFLLSVEPVKVKY